jgi:hypothetical protein
MPYGRMREKNSKNGIWDNPQYTRVYGQIFLIFFFLKKQVV